MIKLILIMWVTNLAATDALEIKIKGQLARFCQNSCELIKVETKEVEEFNENAELGFEALSPEKQIKRRRITDLTAIIQIDERISKTNRDRLESIIKNHLIQSAANIHIDWRVVRYPNFAANDDVLEGLIDEATRKIRGVVEPILARYCSDACVLSYVNVIGDVVTIDRAKELASYEKFSNRNGIMNVRDVGIELSVDENFPEAQREKIINLIRSKTKFFSPVQIDTTLSPFPNEPADKKDPYGLEKMRQMLIMFRDLAGTKEIITNSNSSTNLETQNNTNKESMLSSSSSDNNTMNSESNNSENSKSSQSDSSSEYGENGDIYLWASMGLAGILLLFLLIRFMKANKDSNDMMNALPQSYPYVAPNDQQTNNNPANPQGSSESSDNSDLVLSLKIKDLKTKIADKLLREPQVARETFSRMIKDEGPEETAKYLQIFGSLITKELLGNQALAADLNTLSEFFRQSQFEFSDQEILDLLNGLNTKLTASEILVMSNHHSNHFEFLAPLEISQVHRLISNEKFTVQSIVLTQLDKKTRLALFDLYRGNDRVELMKELVKSDMVPREYLENVAKALKAKVDKNPEYDAQSTSSSQIIFDLLERSDLSEQRRIISSLRSTSMDTARTIMSKLITVEMIPFLRDGHLLEVILGLEQNEVINFLSGLPEHIRNYMLQKAPYELAESWMEELTGQVGFDSKVYKIVEIKIFQKLKNLAGSGLLNIYEINEMIFDPAYSAEAEPATEFSGMVA